MSPTDQHTPRRRAALRLTPALPALMILTLLAGSAAADVLHLRNGREVEGRIVHESKSSVRIVLAGGTVAIPRAQIARIERLPDSRGRIMRLLQSIDRSDPVALRAVAARARELELEDEARDLEALAADLSLRQAIAALGEDPSADALLRLERNLPEKAAPVGVRIVLVRKALDRAKATKEDGDKRLATARMATLIKQRMATETAEARAAQREPMPTMKAVTPSLEPRQTEPRAVKTRDRSKASQDKERRAKDQRAAERERDAELAELQRIRRRFEAELRARKAEQLRCQRLSRRRQAVARRRARRRR